MIQREGFDRIVKLLHEAALDETQWLAATSLISEASRSKGNVLVFCEGGSAVDTDILFARFCFDREHREDWGREYFRNYHVQAERVPRVYRLPHGRLVPTSDLYTDPEKKTSRAYNEVFRRRELHDGLHVRLDGPGGSHIAWGLGNSIERGSWGFDQIRMIRHLVPRQA